MTWGSFMPLTRAGMWRPRSVPWAAAASCPRRPFPGKLVWTEVLARPSAAITEALDGRSQITRSFWDRSSPCYGSAPAIQKALAGLSRKAWRAPLRTANEMINGER
ncbi:hypothetical protein GCM10009647_084620 [Streptomyces sanglieri]